jgi:hypothetical protein
LVITYDRSEFGRQRKTQIYRTYRTHKLISTNSHKHETLRRTIAHDGKRQPFERGAEHEEVSVVSLDGVLYGTGNRAFVDTNNCSQKIMLNIGDQLDKD